MMNRMKYVFMALMGLILVVFFLGQVTLPEDAPEIDGICEELPVEYKITPSENRGFAVAEISTVLPNPIGDGVNAIYVRGWGLTAYIDGELRAHYGGRTPRTYGNSGAAFIPISVGAEDGGKTLTGEIILESGTMNPVYIGNHIGFWEQVFRDYGAELVIAIIALFLSALCVIGGLIVSLTKHYYITIIDLGLGTLLASAWVITNSVFRQFIFRNVATAASIPYFFIAMMPFPFVYYMDQIQQGRYKKLYLPVQLLSISSILLCTVVYAFDIMEVYFIFPYVAACCGISIAAILLTLILDAVRKKIMEYRYAALGIFCAMGSGVVQIILFFRRVGVFSGSVLAFGLILVILFSLLHAFHDFIRMNEETKLAVASNQAKDVFLANMSHEIRTPINAILGLDEMILRESREEDTLHYAADLKSAGRNLLDIINDILDFSKIESGRMDIIPAEYEMRSLLHDIFLLIRMKAEEKGLKLLLRIDPKIPSVLYGDVVRIRQILVNLLSNAVKYTKEGQVTLAIDFQAEGDTAILDFRVEDTGIGLKEEDLATLFERYKRADQSANYGIEGTGLGLAITSHLIELMGSSLSVESVYGEGSVFSFSLRQGIGSREMVGDLSDIEHLRMDTAGRTGEFSGAGSILVVDDQRMNRDVLKGLLKRSGLTIDEAESGEECLAMVKEKAYDLIFLDHRMNGMDGTETLRHLRTDEKPLGEPVIVSLTANAVSGAKEEYLAAGFDDYLAKPVLPEQLAALLKKWLKEGAAIDMEETEEPKEGIPEALREIPGMRLSYAMQFYENEEQLLLGIWDFYEILEPMADEMDDALSAGDDAAFRLKAHTMKSAAESVGAMQLSGVAAFLEKAADAGDTELLAAVTPAFLDEWLGLHETLKPILEKDTGE